MARPGKKSQSRGGSGNGLLDGLFKGEGSFEANPAFDKNPGDVPFTDKKFDANNPKFARDKPVVDTRGFFSRMTGKENTAKKINNAILTKGLSDYNSAKMLAPFAKEAFQSQTDIETKAKREQGLDVTNEAIRKGGLVREQEERNLALTLAKEDGYSPARLVSDPILLSEYMGNARDFFNRTGSYSTHGTIAAKSLAQAAADKANASSLTDTSSMERIPSVVHTGQDAAAAENKFKKIDFDVRNNPERLKGLADTDLNTRESTLWHLNHPTLSKDQTIFDKNLLGDNNYATMTGTEQIPDSSSPTGFRSSGGFGIHSGPRIVPKNKTLSLEGDDSSSSKLDEPISSPNLNFDIGEGSPAPNRTTGDKVSDSAKSIFNSIFNGIYGSTPLPTKKSSDPNAPYSELIPPLSSPDSLTFRRQPKRKINPYESSLQPFIR